MGFLDYAAVLEPSISGASFTIDGMTDVSSFSPLFSASVTFSSTVCLLASAFLESPVTLRADVFSAVFCLFFRFCRARLLIFVIYSTSTGVSKSFGKSLITLSHLARFSLNNENDLSVSDC